MGVGFASTMSSVKARCVAAGSVVRSHIPAWPLGCRQGVAHVGAGLKAHVTSCNESAAARVQVLRGYIGDRSSRPIWGSRQPFDVLGSGYQRPFELATLRLFHMMGVLSKCKKLGKTSAAAARMTACLMLHQLQPAVHTQHVC